MLQRLRLLPFEAQAALLFGVGMPLAETLRRRTRFDDPPAYVDDFLMGGFLLLAFHASYRARPRGPALLCSAWSVVVGAMYYSVFGQLSLGAEKDISGLPNSLVVALKLLTFGIALACVVLSAGRLVPPEQSGDS